MKKLIFTACAAALAFASFSFDGTQTYCVGAGEPCLDFVDYTDSQGEIKTMVVSSEQTSVFDPSPIA